MSNCSREIARANVLGIHMTITTLDEKLARLLEPRAPRPGLRLETVRRPNRCRHLRQPYFRTRSCPGLTDGERQLDGSADGGATGADVDRRSGRLLVGAVRASAAYLERDHP